MLENKMSSKLKDIEIDMGKGMSDKLPVRPFSFQMFLEDPAIVMIAKRGSGKSWVVRAILNHFRHIPVGLIIAPTDRMSCFYGNFFPESYIFYSYKSEIIERVMARQEAIIDKQKLKMQEGKKIDPRCFVVMDDCLGQKGSWVRDQPIQELLFNGRHYKIMYILTMQFPLGITPELRSNFDYIFLLAENYISNQKRMYDHYAGIFPTFESFRQVFKQLTADYGAMVIANRGADDNLFNKIFYYKAPDLSKIRGDMGCKQFKEYHNKNFDSNWKIKSKKFNVDDFLMKKKKNKSMVIVDKIKEEDENVISPITTGKKRTNKTNKQ